MNNPDVVENTITFGTQQQTGAIEFLRKAKAMSLEDKEKICFSLINYLYEMDNETESDLVRKVMDYQIKEAAHEQDQ
jgi:hypothetical protein